MERPAEPEPVRVPLHIRIPRLRWAVILNAGETLEWVSHPVTRPLAELLQTDPIRARPRLRLISIPGMDSCWQNPHLTAPGREQPFQNFTAARLSSLAGF